MGDTGRVDYSVNGWVLFGDLAMLRDIHVV